MTQSNRNRSPRLTRRQRADAESHQTAIITALAASGLDDDIARRLVRCQHSRQHREPGRYPHYRCRSAGCWSCRRNLIRKWWRAFKEWLTGDEVSLAVIPVSADLIIATRKLRRGLRDIRDKRAARQGDHRWRAVAMAGVTDGGRALVLIQHSGIDRAEVWSVLERRYPEIWLYGADAIEPTGMMSAEDAVLLARCRRGVEPLRIVILEQAVAVSKDELELPMPFVW